MHSSESTSNIVGDRPPQLLTPQQQRFFETFGFLKLEGLLRDDIDWVRHEFEAVWEAVGWVHDGSSRSFYNVDIATGEPAPYCHVSRHDIAGIWVAFFSRCHRCGQVIVLLVNGCGAAVIIRQDKMRQPSHAQLEVVQVRRHHPQDLLHKSLLCTSHCCAQERL